MTNVTKEVQKYLAHDIAIQKGLANGLINMSALAKQLKNAYKLEGSIDGIVSAIRRFDAKKAYNAHSSLVRHTFTGATISTKTNLAAAEIRGRKKITKCLSKIKDIINLDRGEVLRLVKGNARMRVIMDQDKIPTLTDSIPEIKEAYFKKNLVEMIVSTNPRVNIDETKGVIAKISNELSMNDINIIEVIFSAPDVLVYVHQKDYMKAHNALLGLCGIKQKL